MGKIYGPGPVIFHNGRHIRSFIVVGQTKTLKDVLALNKKEWGEDVKYIEQRIYICPKCRDEGLSENFDHICFY